MDGEHNYGGGMMKQKYRKTILDVRHTIALRSWFKSNPERAHWASDFAVVSHARKTAGGGFFIRVLNTVPKDDKYLGVVESQASFTRYMKSGATAKQTETALWGLIRKARYVYKANEQRIRVFELIDPISKKLVSNCPVYGREKIANHPTCYVDMDFEDCEFWKGQYPKLLKLSRGKL